MPANWAARLYAALVAWSRVCTDEVCGLLYEDGPIIVRNVAAEPRTAYAMDEAQQLALMTERGWPACVFHTHPGNTHEPSSIDHTNALPGVPYAIGCPDGWAGLWLDGQQIGEATVTETNDVVELYEDGESKWRWRRTAPNGAVISGSEESFDSKSNAARAAQRANPDAIPEIAADFTTEGSVPDLNAPTSAGTTPGPVVGPDTAAP